MALGSATPLRAQDLPSVLPVDPDESRAIAVNPALAAVSGDYFELGLRESFLGITASDLAFTSGFVTWVFGGSVRGLTLRANHFDAPHWRRTRVGLGYARDLTSWASWGAALDWLNHGYSELDLIDANDPVFEDGTSRSVPSLGLGVSMRLGPRVHLGIAGQDLNRPNLALESGARASLPALIHAGLALEMERFRVALGVRDVEWGGRAARGFESCAVDVRMTSWFSAWAGVHAFASNRGAGVEGRVTLARGLEGRYRFEEPFNNLAYHSWGSHQLTFVRGLDRLRPIPPARPFPRAPSPSPSRTGFDYDDHPRFFYLHLSHDQLTHASLDIRRIVDETVRNERVEALSPFMRRTYSDLLDLRFPRHDFVELRVNDPLVALQGTYESPYLRTLGDVSRLLGDQDSVSAAIVAVNGSDLRAGSVWSSLTGTGGLFGHRLPVLAPAQLPDLPSALIDLPSSERRTQLLPDELVVSVVPVRMDDFDGPWALVVRDAHDSVVHRIEGSGLPGDIHWDWLVAPAAPLPAGYYTLRFEWERPDGRRFASRRSSLSVIERRQHIDISVSADSRPAAGAVQRVLLFLEGEASQ